MKLLSEKQAQMVLKILIPVFLAILSIFVFSSKIPKTSFMQETIESLEDNKQTVVDFTGATIATSLAISALPDDFATPLADSLADMNKYYVFILVVIFVERLLVLEGTKIAFILIIPAACALYILAQFIKKDFLKSWAYKLIIFSVAVVLVVPCSTHFVEVVGADYLAYVNETINETNAGADKINELMSSDSSEDSFFDRLSQAFKTAIEGVSDLLAYFKNVLKRCVNSIAILIVTNFVMPLLTIWFFKWLMKELFSISLLKAPMKVTITKDKEE